MGNSPFDQRHCIPSAGSRRAALQRHSQHHLADVPADQRRQDAGLPTVPNGADRGDRQGCEAGRPRHRRSDERGTEAGGRIGNSSSARMPKRGGSDRELRQIAARAIEAQKTERKALPTIRDVVLELLPGAVEIEASSGFMFNTRRLVYRIRDAVMQRTGKELTQSYFDDLLTHIEAEQGDLHPLLIREARGNYSIPHFPARRHTAWHSERAGLSPAVMDIQQDRRDRERRPAPDVATGGMGQRHDAFLTSAKGFTTRAARDLIDKIADTTEPVKVFSVHDGDGPGRSSSTLCNTPPWRARPARSKSSTSGCTPGKASHSACRRESASQPHEERQADAAAGRRLCPRTDRPRAQ